MLGNRMADRESLPVRQCAPHENYNPMGTYEEVPKFLEFEPEFLDYMEEFRVHLVEKIEWLREISKKENTIGTEALTRNRITDLAAFETKYIVDEFSEYEKQFELETPGLEEPDWCKLERIVKRLQFFKKFDKDLRIRVLQNSKVRVYAPGKHIFRQGDYGDTMYVILSGSVDVRIKKVDKSTGFSTKRTVNFLEDGQSFGEYAMMGTRVKEAENLTFIRLRQVIGSMADRVNVLKGVIHKEGQISSQVIKVLIKSNCKQNSYEDLSNIRISIKKGYHEEVIDLSKHIPDYFIFSSMIPQENFIVEIKDPDHKLSYTLSSVHMPYEPETRMETYH